MCPVEVNISLVTLVNKKCSYIFAWRCSKCLRGTNVCGQYLTMIMAPIEPEWRDSVDCYFVKLYCLRWNIETSWAIEGSVRGVVDVKASFIHAKMLLPWLELKHSHSVLHRHTRVHAYAQHLLTSRRKQAHTSLYKKKKQSSSLHAVASGASCAVLIQ